MSTATLASKWPDTMPSATLATKNPELASVLDSICVFLQRYVRFSSPAQPTAIALWVAHTWALDAFDYTPYLRIDSPEKQCGKSRVLDCLEPITPKAWRTISPSEAVLFREIDRDRPTLLLDETDTLFCNGKDDRAESLRALLNAGFERKARVSPMRWTREHLCSATLRGVLRESVCRDRFVARHDTRPLYFDSAGS